MNGAKAPRLIKRESLQPADLIGMTLLVAMMLFFGFHRSHQKMFWSDEIMGWSVIQAPNWHTLLERWNAGIDSSGIFFYLLGRPWLAIFGASERSLRMFSAAGIAGSAAILWFTARRFYSILPVAAAVTFVYTGIVPLRWQLANGRTYGILMLACAIAAYLLLRGEEPDTHKPSATFLLATFLGYSFLNGSHILGCMYAGMFLAIQLVLDARSRRFRPMLYIVAICSFTVCYLSRFNIAATSALGKPSFWTPKPILKELLTMDVLFGHRVALGILLAFFAIIANLQFRKERAWVYILVAGCAVMNVLVFACSMVSTSIYVDRYLLPLALAAILILCEFFQQLSEAEVRWKAWTPALPLAFLAIGIATFLLNRLRQTEGYPIANYTSALLATLPAGVPVVDCDVGSFVELEFYHHDDRNHPLLFPVDWGVALDPENKGGVSGFHELDNFKKEGIYSADIVSTASVLQRLPKFVVLTTRPNIWLKHRVFESRAFRSTRLPTGTPGLESWLVERIQTSDPTAQSSTGS